MDKIDGFKNCTPEKLKKSACSLRMISHLLHIKATAIYDFGNRDAQKFKDKTRCFGRGAHFVKQKKFSPPNFLINACLLIW